MHTNIYRMDLNLRRTSYSEVMTPFRTTVLYVLVPRRTILCVQPIPNFLCRVWHWNLLCRWRFVMVRLIHRLRSGGSQASMELVTTEVIRRHTTPVFTAPCTTVAIFMQLWCHLLHHTSAGLHFCRTTLSQMAVDPWKPQTFSTVHFKVHTVFTDFLLM